MKKTTSIYFKINNQLYITNINKYSIKNFKFLISNYIINSKIVEPVENSKYKYISIDSILKDAYKKLNNPLAIDIVAKLIAQNVEKPEKIIAN